MPQASSLLPHECPIYIVFLAISLDYVYKSREFTPQEELLYAYISTDRVTTGDIDEANLSSPHNNRERVELASADWHLPGSSLFARKTRGPVSRYVAANDGESFSK